MFKIQFQIKTDRKETENKTVRFPLKLIEQIEKAIQGHDITFSGFVLQACEFALKSMTPDNAKENDK